MGKTTPTSAGFTLIEMAVVLAIVGVLAGGILAGTKMIEASRLKRVPMEASAYASAFEQFKVKYSQYPGDYTEAARIWGRADGGTDLYGSCASAGSDISSSNPQATCNGNGDWRVIGNETFRAWQQMANAGLVTGKFNGLNGSGGSGHAVAGYNVPIGPLRGSAFNISTNGNKLSDATFFDGNYDNTLVFGKESTSAPVGNMLTGQQAYDIDLKFDDSLPGLGVIRTYKGTALPGTNPNGRSCAGENGGDVTPTSAETAGYRRAVTGPLCFLYFMQGYGLQHMRTNE